MRNLKHDFIEMCRRNKDGSIKTQSNRKAILVQVASQLKDAGYRQMRASSLKPKHVEALLNRWRSDNVSVDTLKNRMAVVRWWAEKVDKASVVAKDNAHYGIGNRSFVPTENKAWEMTREKLDRATDPYIRMALEMQWRFGLRREEAMKFTPHASDRGDKLVIYKGTKGGREREIPIRTPEQRELVDRAKALAGRGSLIPPTKIYKDQLNLFEYQTRKAGLSHTHGMRHQYAQDRYVELTGRPAPIAGGPKCNTLTAEEKRQDEEARKIISAELGHARESITNAYLAR